MDYTSMELSGFNTILLTVTQVKQYIYFLLDNAN
jgi:hypothetical protein